MNGLDNRIYTIGRGPSATTIQAPLTQITAGNKVVIQGTVMDVSAGTQQDEQAARFVDGIPVASCSMKDWMDTFTSKNHCQPTSLAFQYQ